jgi:cobaltochelatase CobN
MDNADKLIALIYYNYPPGKDNIGSSYLDTITSLYNLLLVLKEEGYTVENIPESADDLEDLMIALGINVANWAPGELQKLVDNPNIILYPVDDYMEWFEQLDEITQLQVVEGPVAYIGELCKRAVELDYTSEMASRIETWYSGMLSLLPDEDYDVAVPILDNIVTTLKNYIISYDSADYDTFLVYKAQFLALDINGTTGWGEAPGDIMVVEKNGVQYFVIPGLQFGNIFIGPEPQRGWEADIALLYHSTVVAPPHQYLAYYAYLQEKGTNAMVFMGRHATHEWLPGKELVLSPNDFPSICVGNVPQIYYYIVDGLAEGIQAKRRGYAVIISHLTPPMTFTNLYGDLGTLATLTDQYDGATSTEKTEIITQVKSLISSNYYDLGVDISTLSDDRLMEALEEYLDDIQSTLYPYGLHAIGEAWSDDEIALMVTSILSVEFEITNSTESTTLHDEISQIMNGKAYDDLTTLEKEEVQEQCVNVVESLIYWDVNTVANIITSSPSNNLLYTLQLAKYYIWAINQSVENEVSNLIDALNGGYIEPGAGGDPVANPNVLPTGTNFYDDQASEIPTEEAYEYAKILTLLALADITDDTEKIAMGIWCVETARDDGALVSVVLYLLGMEPVWSDSPSAGVDGQKLKEMPVYVELEDLVRPDGWEKKRIDVTIITSGLFRDLYSRQAELMDNAFRVALARSYYTIINDATLQAKYGSDLNDALDTIMKGIGYYGAGSESLDDNYVAKHWVEDFEYYMSLNMTIPEDMTKAMYVGELAITRIFAPPEGDYGAGISKLVSMSWTWDDSSELGEFYINRMANMYSHNNWGTSNPVVFTRALSGIGTVFTSRNTNLYGVLDNDDYFDYWGGLSMAIEYVNGKAPTMYVLDYSDKNDPDSISLEQYMNRELTTRYYNPEWIKGMMNEGYSGARYMSKKFISNLLGWQTTRPGSVQNWMWDKVVDVYLRDSYNLGVTDFLSSGNNAYAMISLTGTMLTAAYEGYWTTDAATMSLVANTWAQMIIQNGVACCDCSCGNIAMMEWATNYVNADLLAHLNSMLYEATQNAAFTPGQTPQSNPTTSTSTGSQSSSSESSSQSQDSSSSGSSSAGDEESESTTTPGEEGEGKSYEVSEQSSGATSESGLPIVAIVGVIALIALVGFGYFKGNFKKK